MRIHTLMLTTVTFLLVAGCASMPAPIDPSDALDPSKGVLLAAVTSDGQKQVIDAWFYYKHVDSDEAERLDAFGLSPGRSLGRAFGMDSKADDYPDDTLRVGRLIALPVEAGEYELVNWTLYISQLGGYAYLSPKVVPPPHAFTIFPGKVTYLGNLHIDTIVGETMFGASMSISRSCRSARADG